MDFKNIVVYLIGLASSYAYVNLSFRKVTSQSSTWPGNAYHANNAVDGNNATCMRIDSIGGTFLDNSVWWKVDLGGVYNIHSVTILFKNYDDYGIKFLNRQRGRFAGFSLYVSNTDVSTISDIKNSTLCYKDGPQLPPLNFTTTCTEHGRYVVFYNERLDRMTYPSGYEIDNVVTELCEVIVQVCGDWTYGYDCVNNCSGHCLNSSSCNRQTGYCDRGCNPGYTDSDCSSECSPGYFGLDCRERCIGHCINEEPCDHVSGFCPRGCMDGYIGRHCNIFCQPGYYGTNCSLACPLNCKTCRHTDGLCSCKAGWMGQNCSTECTQSYGENCQNHCSEQCINQTCDRFNGNCLCDAKYDSLRNVDNTDEPSNVLWIVAFSISLLLNITFIPATLLSRRKTFLKQKPKADEFSFSWQSGSNTDKTASADDQSHYHELHISKDENTYQTLNQR